MVGDVRTTRQGAAAAAGRSVTVAWELGHGATATAPWGTRGKVTQIFFARS